MSIPTIKAACEYFGISEDTFFSERRFHEIIRARRAVIYVMRNRDGQSFPQIGKRIGRDHSTVIHNHRHAEIAMTEDDDFAAFVDAQMALPKYSPRAVIMQLVRDEPPAPAMMSKPVLPPCPQHLIKLRKPEIKRSERFHSYGYGATSVALDDDGMTPEDDLNAKRLVRGSRALLATLMEQHPERFVA